jgi:hypothetical protein
MAHRPGLLEHWKHNHWHDALSSVEPSLLNTTADHAKPCWPLLRVGPPAGDRSQAGAPLPYGHPAAVDEVDVAEADEAVENPPAADDAAVVEGREDDAVAGADRGEAVTKTVWPRGQSPDPARSPSSCLSW